MKSALARMCLAAALGSIGALGVEQDSNLGGIDVLDASYVLANIESVFKGWALAHGKEYVDDSRVLQQRRAIFEANTRFIADHNQRFESVRLSLNEFADLTYEEFTGMRLGYDLGLKSTDPHDSLLGSFRYADAEAPDEIDWVSKGAVTGIKNQGSCGSCWAFSTTGSIEGVNFLTTGDLVALSEQELVDCDRKQDAGCGGGLMDNAFQYIVTNGGLDSERDYAYWGGMPSFCNQRKQSDRHVVDITGFEDVPHGDEDALRRAVANQPVSVAICVNRALMFYHSGVFDAACCDGLNHGVLLVGYGTDSEGGEYWKVKNSWGLGWGEAGYFRLKRGVGAGGQCGIAKMASYPVKDDHSDPRVPTICDAQWFSLWECPVGTQCQCDFSLFGLFCFVYSCPPKDAVSCGASGTFCPAHAPHCEHETGQCKGDTGVVGDMLHPVHATRRG